eukprot:TRINITY_DN3720_c0_g1_i2.p1 TRINITY_DN3720_c0_g1~~TRINITY_DN3720_c0_g1_i2.p1  ORF type:complete len:1412 (+),score=225.99 TRINITY_DN3720_c0_g1_i2:23-4237(+)
MESYNTDDAGPAGQHRPQFVVCSSHPQLSEQPHGSTDSQPPLPFIAYSSQWSTEEPPEAINQTQFAAYSSFQDSQEPGFAAYSSFCPPQEPGFAYSSFCPPQEPRIEAYSSLPVSQEPTAYSSLQACQEPGFAAYSSLPASQEPSFASYSSLLASQEPGLPAYSSISEASTMSNFTSYSSKLPVDSYHIMSSSEAASLMYSVTPREVCSFSSAYNSAYGSENNLVSISFSSEDDSDLEDVSDNSEASHEPPPVAEWNTRFQELIAMTESASKFRKLSSLSMDFVSVAETYGKIIISENYIPDSMKTITPASVGGIAGGRKYICQGILFKFALDTQISPGLWMYGGKKAYDEKAIKAACNEKKGLTCYWQCGIPGLYFPLMCLIHYRGFCLIAVSVLPLSKGSLAYGSNDAGNTVYASNEELNQKMLLAGQKLNIQGHLVRDKTIYGPGDIEGHVGTDGKFYVLDFGRVLPPEAPGSIPNALFYNLLRPQLVQSFPSALCSDAFSGWLAFESTQKRAEYNEKVVSATAHLYNILIPKFAERLETGDETLRTADALISGLHQAGINIRHLGRVRSLVTNEFARKILLEEIVARTLKNMVREELRETMKTLRVSVEDPYLTLITKFLRPIFSRTRPHPQKLVLPKWETIPYQELASMCRFTDDENLEVENFASPPTKWCGFARETKSDPNSRGVPFGISECQAVYSDTWYCPAIGRSDYMEFTLLKGDRIFYGFSLLPTLSETISIDCIYGVSEAPNVALTTEFFHKFYLINHNGKVVGPHHLHSKLLPRSLSQPFKEGDTVGMLWDNNRIVLIINGEVKASYKFGLVTFGVTQMWKRLLLLPFNGVKLGVNFGNKPFVANLRQICKETGMPKVSTVSKVSGKAVEFWTKLIKPEIENRFPCALSQSEVKSDLRQGLDIKSTVERWEKMTGIKLSRRLHKALAENDEVKVHLTDVREINSRVSFMDIINFSKAAATALEIKEGTSCGVEEELKLLGKARRNIEASTAFLVVPSTYAFWMLIISLIADRETDRERKALCYKDIVQKCGVLSKLDNESTEASQIGGMLYFYTGMALCKFVEFSPDLEENEKSQYYAQAADHFELFNKNFTAFKKNECLRELREISEQAIHYADLESLSHQFKMLQTMHDTNNDLDIRIQILIIYSKIYQIVEVHEAEIKDEVWIWRGTNYLCHKSFRMAVSSDSIRATTELAWKEASDSVRDKLLDLLVPQFSTVCAKMALVLNDKDFQEKTRALIVSRMSKMPIIIGGQAAKILPLFDIGIPAMSLSKYISIPTSNCPHRFLAEQHLAYFTSQKEKYQERIDQYFSVDYQSFFAVMDHLKVPSTFWTYFFNLVKQKKTGNAGRIPKMENGYALTFSQKQRRLFRRRTAVHQTIRPYKIPHERRDSQNP